MSITTSKLGVRFGTVYYYKQKVVNWSFVAPNKYACIFSAVTDSAFMESSTAIKLEFVRSYIDAAIHAYVTESSYRENAVLYDVQITNITSPLLPVTIVSINSTDVNSEAAIVYPEKRLATAEPYTLSGMWVKRLGKMFPLNDRAVIKVSTRVPNGVFSREVAIKTNAINYVNSVQKLIGPSVLHGRMYLSLGISKSIKKIPVTSETFFPLETKDPPIIPETYSTTNVYMSITKYVTGIVQGNAQETVTTHFTVEELCNITRTDILFVTSTTIVH